MKIEDVEKPRNLITALIFSGLAWIVLCFLRSPGAEPLTDKADEANGAVAPS